MSDLIGNMDKVVLFRTNSGAQLGAGGQDAYTDLLTTRGSLKKVSGRTGLSFGDILTSDTWTLIVRVQSALTAALSNSLRISIDSRSFKVDSWEDVNEDHFYYKFTITEQRA
jgi:hypothetical protein